MYEDHENIEDVIEKSNWKTTKFLAWMKANQKYPAARNLTYNQFPMKFSWKVATNEWTPRQLGFSIGRVHFAPHGSGEIFYLRTLLNYIKGPTSFDDIKIVDNVKYNSFKDTCFVMGLLDDDKEIIDAIVETSLWGTCTFLRRLFSTLLVPDQISRPEVVWNNTFPNLIDDILHKQRRMLGAHSKSIYYFSHITFFIINNIFLMLTEVTIIFGILL